MTLLDGGRWDRFRRSGFELRSSRDRPVNVWLDFAAWPIPLPSLYVFFEDNRLDMGLRVGNRSVTDDVLNVGVGVDLPDAVADALCVVWPGRVERGGRRASLERLRGGS